MSTAPQLRLDVDNILNKQWNIRDGQIIPTTEDVALAGGAVKLKSHYIVCRFSRFDKVSNVL